MVSQPIRQGLCIGGRFMGRPALPFGNYGAFPGSHAPASRVFRSCATRQVATGEEGAMPLAREGSVRLQAGGRGELPRWQEQYYHYAQPPLDAQIIEVKETEDWRREKITYVGAEGERAIAYLSLPKHYAPPWQVIQFIPPGDPFRGFTRWMRGLRRLMRLSSNQAAPC